MGDNYPQKVINKKSFDAITHSQKLLSYVSYLKDFLNIRIPCRSIWLEDLHKRQNRDKVALLLQ